MAAEETGNVLVQPLPPPRRKGIGVRTWVVVSESGKSLIHEAGKHSIMRRTGLPARDLRVLDPVLSYPSSILGRERAIVVNLEHIRAIITATEVLMVNSTSPLVVEFLHDLQQRISRSDRAPSQQIVMDNGMDIAGAFHDDVHRNSIKVSSKRASRRPSSLNAPPGEMIDDNSPKTATERHVADGPKVLPFEFIALEACLESACKCLESETRTLEEEAYPALDELTSKISTLNLERVRMIKSRLVAISGRVQKVRDEIENLLDDDNDMAEMYLTEKLVARSVDHTLVKEEVCNSLTEGDDERDDDQKSVNTEISSSNVKPNVEDLEMLLEAYFVQIDGILQKLSDMSDYVDDTEDCINIMLDDKQNQLLQMGVMLSTANMILNAGIVVVALFGMNISITLFDAQPKQFWATAIGTVGGCIAMFLFAFGWGKKRNLLAS